MENLRHSLLLSGVAHSAGSLVNVSQLTHGDDVVWCGLEDQSELCLGLFQPAELDERAAERDPGRGVCRVLDQPCVAHADGLVVFPGPPVLFGELRKRNRRRILQDPASKFFNPWVVRHAYIMGLRSQWR